MCSRTSRIRPRPGSDTAPDLTRYRADHPFRRHCLWHAVVHPCRRSGGHHGPDELHQPGPWCLRHGGWIHHGVADAACRRTVPGVPANRVHRDGAAGRTAGGHALPAHVCKAPSGPGAVHHRADLHGGGQRRLFHRVDPADRAIAGLPQGPHRVFQWRPGHGALQAVHHRGVCRPDDRPAVRPRPHPLWQPLARRGGRSACCRRARHQCERGVPVHLRGRFRTGRTGRRAGRRGAGAGPDLSAQVHDLFPDRGGGGWNDIDHRAAVGGLAARHCRR